MIARCRLAAIDFDHGLSLEQAKTKSGKGSYNFCYSKITKTWSANPYKEAKSLRVVFKLVDQTERLIIENRKITLTELPPNQGI